MTYSNTQARNDGLRERIAAVFATIGDAIEQRRIYHRTVRELSELNDRELADLGIHRADIQSISAEAASRQF